MRPFALLCLAALAAFAACRTGKKSDNETKEQLNEKGGNGHVVMVIDSGIDPTHAAYRDRVIASYTLACAEEESLLKNIDPTTTSAGKIKEKILQNIKNAKEGSELEKCQLKEGITTRVTPAPASARTHRLVWNQAVKSKDLEVLRALPLQTLSSILSFEKKSLWDFHGTNTTAAIAYKNPHVKLALVEIPIGDLKTEKKLTCRALERLIPIFNSFGDSQIKDAISKKFSNPEDAIIARLAKQHEVTLVNKSFGIDRGVIHKRIEEAGCVPQLEQALMTHLAGYQEIKDHINNRLNIGYDQVSFITVQSAGNSGIEISRRMDRPFCSGATQQLSVGSYDVNGGISFFSNRGSCVNLYAPGNMIITSNPQDFLTITQGTSIAAPLAVRYLSFEFSRNTPPKDMVAQLKSRLSAQKFIPPSGNFTYASLVKQDKSFSLVDTRESYVLDDAGPLDWEMLPRNAYENVF